MVHQLHSLVLHSSPLMVVKKGEWIQVGIDKSQHTPWEWYYKNMGIMAKGEKLKSPGMLVGRPSQCIYRMVQGFLTHGILLSIVFIYGFWPILIFRVFLSFLERVGINHNKCSSSLYLWERIMMFRTIFSGNTIMKVKMREIMLGIWCMAMV